MRSSLGGEIKANGAFENDPWLTAAFTEDRPYKYCIHLKISPADREDAWELCRVILQYGGEETCECTFVFVDKERWLAAIDTVRFGFGAEYFEAADLTPPDGE